MKITPFCLTAILVRPVPPLQPVPRGEPSRRSHSAKGHLAGAAEGLHGRSACCLWKAHGREAGQGTWVGSGMAPDCMGCGHRWAVSVLWSLGKGNIHLGELKGWVHSASPRTRQKGMWHQPVCSEWFGCAGCFFGGWHFQCEWRALFLFAESRHLPHDTEQSSAATLRSAVPEYHLDSEEWGSKNQQDQARLQVQCNSEH